MNLEMIPAAKRTKLFGGEFHFESLNLFTVGEGGAFARTLHALLPEIKVVPAEREQANTVLSVAGAYSGKSEYCAIRILEDHMEIHCCDEQGARNAACILAQLLINNRTRNALPCGSIEDWPDASYRAMMLESSGRVWMPTETLHGHLRRMALARMNVLQFHFMEHSGCTLALDCLPSLPGYGPQNLKYTKEEIRDLVAYAERLGIGVCPFVEVISHATAFATAAGIACPGDREPALFTVCVGQEKTFEVIEKVLAEVAEIFPDPVIHIGGDEYDLSEVTPFMPYWDRCPHCRALSEKMGFHTLRELFIYGVSRVNKIVNKLGKVAMLWNADLLPGQIPESLDRNLLIHYYRKDNPLCKEKIAGLSMDGYVEDGFSTVNSNYSSTYLDRYVRTERLMGWGYDTDPLVKKANRGGVSGGCCCAWEDHAHFALSIAPAIFLFGDRLWNSHGDPTNYDTTFSVLLTTLLFEGRLPKGMNLSDGVGDVLPCVSGGKTLFLPNNLSARPEEIEALAQELEKLEDPLAKSYAELVREAACYRRERLAAAPKTVSEKFEG